MGFIALILSLMLEQLRPLTRTNPVHGTAAGFAARVLSFTDAGQRSHGVIGWVLIMGPALIGLAAFEWLLGWFHPLAVLVLHVVVLYFTMGFRQFSHAFTEIQIALAANDPQGARDALQRWVRQSEPGFEAADLSTHELCRVAIARALISAHRYVFGPLFWYMLLPGVLGPVLYRGAQFLSGQWAMRRTEPVLAGTSSPAAARQGGPQREAVAVGLASPAYAAVALAAYRWLDWLPARLASAGFAIVGNFEDAVYCWRAAAVVRGGDEQRRLLLMVGGGALGVRIADPEIEADVRTGQVRGADSDVAGGMSAGGMSAGTGFDWQGIEPDAPSLRSAVGLVWRAVVLWVLLFAMLTIANWLGR
jgi:adenosylcobinamide-phosphate synthase